MTPMPNVYLGIGPNFIELLKQRILLNNFLLCLAEISRNEKSQIVLVNIVVRLVTLFW